jgi:alpha-ketoglutarate-dependent taurine dioxygenase
MIPEVMRRVIGSPLLSSSKFLRSKNRHGSQEIFFRHDFSKRMTRCEQSNPCRFDLSIVHLISRNFTRTGTTTPTTMTRTMSTHAVNEDDEYEENVNHAIDTTSMSYSVNVSHNGQCICITAQDDETSWTFAAPILWVNDPHYIHPTSGQRTRTLGGYSRSTFIRTGQVILYNNDNNNDNNSNNDTSVLHPQPLPGSFHPRGGIYQFENKDDKKNRIRFSPSVRELLQVEWNSGQVSSFDLYWLLHHAELGRIGAKASLEAFDRKQDQWQARSLPFPALMTDTCPSNQTRVTKDIAIQSIHVSNKNHAHVSSSIPVLEYCDVMDNEETLLLALKGIYEYGAILLQNAPVLFDHDHVLNDPLCQKEQESVVGNLGKKFSGGTLSHGSLYGDIFHVQSKNEAENIAYTNVGLPPHQDLTYYESKPFLQLLHCVNSGSIMGGESVLIDSMAAAEELRRLAPDMFDVLCQTEATFLKERAGADMVSPKRHIVTDPSLGHVVEVNWSPPFEGPLQLSQHVVVENYVRAYQAMECMLNDQQSVLLGKEAFDSFLPKQLELELKEYAKRYTWVYALQPGDILVFNNQRMLHGRREFTSIGSAQRHLIGCYTDAMDTTSRYRQMLRERGGTGGGGYGKRNPGNGCRWM